MLRRLCRLDAEYRTLSPRPSPSVHLEEEKRDADYLFGQTKTKTETKIIFFVDIRFVPVQFEIKCPKSEMLKNFSKDSFFSLQKCVSYMGQRLGEYHE